MRKSSCWRQWWRIFSLSWVLVGWLIVLATQNSSFFGYILFWDKPLRIISGWWCTIPLLTHSQIMSLYHGGFSPNGWAHQRNPNWLLVHEVDYDQVAEPQFFATKAPKKKVTSDAAHDLLTWFAGLTWSPVTWCGFPEPKGLPPVIIYLNVGFSLTKTIHWGVSLFPETPIFTIWLHHLRRRTWNIWGVP